MVDKTMMGDKCAELVRAAMIGALAVTLGNPTAVYAAEEETADPGQIGIEIAGEAAVGAASFCVEEDAASEVIRENGATPEQRRSLGDRLASDAAVAQVIRAANVYRERLGYGPLESEVEA